MTTLRDGLDIRIPVQRSHRAVTVSYALPGSARLPTAPDDVTKFVYFGAQHRWFIWLRTLASVSAAVSLAIFAAGSSSLWLFLIPFSIVLIYLTLMHYTTTRRRRLTRRGHERLVASWSPSRLPSVDVFLPTAGEALEILENTYRHVAALAYDGAVRVLVLDDSGRESVARLARRFNFDYHVRPDRPLLKKAGNLKYGFERSTGDMFAILDADFCPRTDFLTELLPYFDNPAVGIVQSPQYFEVRSTMQWLERGAAAVQESFYRWAQVSRDRLGAPICVGTCAVYRRSAIELIGGIPQIAHSEDIHTGVNLLKRGFRTRYVPVVLATGLCPDNLASFISQQYRWCQGSMSLLRDQDFHDAPLSNRQRLSFFAGFGYYICTAVAICVLPLPTLVMLWWIPQNIALGNFIWLVPALTVAPVAAWVHHSGWRPADLRLYTISSFCHVVAIIDTLRERAAEWKPTGEIHQTPTTKRVVRSMVGWMMLSNVATYAGVVHYLVMERSVVSVAPLLAGAMFTTWIWVPIAAMAWRERKVGLSTSVPTTLRVVRS